MSQSEQKKPAPQPEFGLKIACGLLGVLLAAIISGLSERLPGLALVDISGAHGFGHDSTSWLNTAYSAGEIAVMPFATWFAITFSLRRFHLIMLSITLIFAAILPFMHSLPMMISVRLLQGITAGALIPLLMMSALRFLPLSIRLHGLALYAMTATFAPNISLWLTSLAVDSLADWRWAFWLVIPPGLIALALVAWGIPVMPLATQRIKSANWFGMAFGIPGLMLLVVGLSQGVRLDWFCSPLIKESLFAALILCTVFLVSEWFHPAPFIKLQLLARRNIWLGFVLFFCMLILMGSAVSLPATVLENLQGFRLAQVSSLGLIVGLPQLILGPLVALLLYRPWIDARKLFALGLILMAISYGITTHINDQWMTSQFIVAMVLQAFGQPLAVVSMLFLATSVVQPMEGPYVSGTINTLRAAGTVFGSALIGQLSFLRGSFHHEMLLNNLGARWPAESGHTPLAQVSGWINQQAALLSAADISLIFAIAALVLIPGALYMTYIPAPRIPAKATESGTPSTQNRHG